MALFIYLIVISSGVFADPTNDHSIHEVNQQSVLSALNPTYESPIHLTGINQYSSNMPSSNPSTPISYGLGITEVPSVVYNPSTPTYGSALAEVPSVPPVVYNPSTPTYGSALTEVPSVASNAGITTTVTPKPSNFYTSVTPTVLTPYELYQSRWCAGLLRSPQPIPSDPSQLSRFEAEYVIPEYRMIWYRTCYLPHRGLGVATVWFDRGLLVANTAFRGAIGTANSALSLGQNVLSNILNGPTSSS